MNNLRKLILLSIAGVALLGLVIAAVFLINSYIVKEHPKGNTATISCDGVDISNIRIKTATIQEGYCHYQSKIETATNQKAKAALYEERNSFILRRDIDNLYTDLVLDGYIKIDDIRQSVSSAAQVLNYASGHSDIMAKYQKILEERQNTIDDDIKSESEG